MTALGRAQSGAPAAVALLPAEPGVYRFRDAAGRVAYLGRATNLRQRVRSYWGPLDDRPHLRRMTIQIARIEAVVCASGHEAAWLERNLLERSLPRWNRLRGGTETPCWLVLDDQERSPGLQPVFEAPPRPATVHGPYLGWERAGLARDALLRLYPLHLAGDRLGAGQLAFAQARGVTPQARATYVAELQAVLGRDPEALRRARSGLLAARERAAAALGFETAGRIQQELAALDWLTGEQRVTGCVPTDLSVTGWADGTLFRLQAEQGRLNRWSLREASRAAGLRASASTPEPWRALATRNAELGAALAHAQRT